MRGQMSSDAGMMVFGGGSAVAGMFKNMNSTRLEMAKFSAEQRVKPGFNSKQERIWPSIQRPYGI